MGKRFEAPRAVRPHVYREQGGTHKGRWRIRSRTPLPGSLRETSFISQRDAYTRALVWSAARTLT